jgi:hypothetical protein
MIQTTKQSVSKNEKQEAQFLDSLTAVHGEEFRAVYLSIKAEQHCSRTEAVDRAIKKVDEQGAIRAPGRVASFRTCR